MASFLGRRIALTLMSLLFEAVHTPLITECLLSSHPLQCVCLRRPPLCLFFPPPGVLHVSPPWHFRRNLIWVCLAFPLSCRLSLPPLTLRQTESIQPRAANTRCCWPHYLLLTFQVTPASFHSLFSSRLKWKTRSGSIRKGF